MSVFAESGITGRTKRCNIAEVKRGKVWRAIGQRPRRVGNVTSDIPENKADGGFESRIRVGLAPRKPLETSCKL